MDIKQNPYRCPECEKTVMFNVWPDTNEVVCSECGTRIGLMGEWCYGEGITATYI